MIRAGHGQGLEVSVIIGYDSSSLFLRESKDGEVVRRASKSIDGANYIVSRRSKRCSQRSVTDAFIEQ